MSGNRSATIKPVLDTCNLTSLPLKARTLEQDISGIGVVLSFVLSACLSTLLLILLYFLKEDVSQNPVDLLVFRLFGKVKRSILWSMAKGPKTAINKHERLVHVLESGIIVYSDTQMITGLAMLISGFVQLSRGISIYHWVILGYLASCSSITHLATLTMIRSKTSVAFKMAFWRFPIMVSSLALLSAAMVPVGWATRMNIPFSIQTTHLFTTDASKLPVDIRNCVTTYDYGIWAISAYLIGGYIVRPFQLFPPIQHFWRKNVIESLDRKLSYLYISSEQKYLEKRGWLHSTVHWCCKSFFYLMTIYGKALCYVIGSMVLDLIWLFTGLLFVGLSLITIVMRSIKGLSPMSEEMTWNFGQTLPLILLVLPLFLMVQCAYEYRDTICIPKDCEPYTRRDHTYISADDDKCRTQWFSAYIYLILFLTVHVCVYLLMMRPQGPSPLQLRGRGFNGSVRSLVALMLFWTVMLTIFVPISIALRPDEQHVVSTRPNHALSARIKRSMWIIVTVLYGLGMPATFLSTAFGIGLLRNLSQ